MKFLVSIYQDEDGAYIAECPSIPGCVSQGQTESEAESNIADAIRECLGVRAELGMPPTVTREVIRSDISKLNAQPPDCSTWFRC